MSSALNSLQRSGVGMDVVVDGASGLRKKSVKSGGGYVLRNGVCLFLGKVSKGVERTVAAGPAGRSLGREPNELFNEKWLVTFLSFLREWMFVNGDYMSAGDVQRVFVKSGLIEKESVPAQMASMLQWMDSELAGLSGVDCMSKGFMVVKGLSFRKSC